MDTLADNEVKSIWQRVKRYINPENIKAGSREELEKEIEKQMKMAGSSNKQGDMDLLIKRGFPKRLSKTEEVQIVYTEPRTEAGKKFQKEKLEKAKLDKPQVPDMNRVRQRKGNKIGIKVKGRFRAYSENTIRITKGSYKGKASYYIYNIYLKKRLTWGLIK